MKRISLCLLFTLLAVSGVVAGPPPDPLNRVKRIEASLRGTNLFGVPQVVGISKQNIIDFLGVPTANAGCPPTGQARAYYDPNTDTFYVRDSNCNIIISGGGGGTNVRLDQVLNPNQNKLFLLGGTALGFSGGTFDLSGTTWSKLSVSAGCTTTASGQICFDSTNSNWHLWNGADSFLPAFSVASPPTSGDLVGFLLAAGKWTLQDLGPVNGTSGNSFVQVNVSNLTNNDSICWNSSSSQWDNCSSGVPIFNISSTTYAVGTSDAPADRGDALNFTGAGTGNWTIAQASTSGSFDANWFALVMNSSAFTLNITATTSVFKFSGLTGSTLSIPPGQIYSILSDPTGNGTYYVKGGPAANISGELSATGGIDVNTIGWFGWSLPNNSPTGTTLNKMVCNDGSGNGIICPHATSTTNNAQGVAYNGVGLGGTAVGPGTTGNTGICWLGFCKVIFDNSATAGHYAQESSTVDGDLSDVGATKPTNSQDFYYIWLGNSGAGTAATIRNLTPEELSASGNNGGGKGTNLQVNGTATKPIANLNSTTPAAGANNQNLTVQSSVSGGTTNVSIEVPLATTGQAGLVQLAGDLGGTSAAPTVTQVNGLAVPASAAYLTTNSSRQLTATDFPDVKIIPAANCPNAVAGSGWSYAASTWTAVCRAGSNNLGGALQLAPSVGGAAQFRIQLPADWDSASQPFIRIEYASGANTSGTVIWTVASACTKSDGSVTDDPAFNAESAFATQTMAVANRGWSQTGQFTAITSGNNCVPNGGLIIKLTLSGSASSPINAYQAIVTTPRLPKVQAN